MNKAGENEESDHFKRNQGFQDMDFDGKKSQTAIGKNRTESIDHVTCVSNGEYLDHFSVQKKEGNAKALAFQIHDILKKYLAENSLIYIGCDSTAVNTGWQGHIEGKGGVISILEHKFLFRPLFWVSWNLKLLFQR